MVKANSAETYGTEDLAKALGMSMRQLQWLDEREVVTPEHEGHARHWNRHDAYLAAVAKRFRKLGSKVKAGSGFRKAIHTVDRLLTHSQPRFLILTRSHVEHADSKGQLFVHLEKLSEQGIPSIVMDLDAIGRRLERRGHA